MTHTFYTEKATPTPHNAASKGEIAPFVLFPGDPERAEFIANNYLQNSHKVTSIRGMLGFTGNYNGKAVSVMGSGMGGSSAGLYSYELFAFYDVEQIVRIGTAGGLQKDMTLGALVFALTASTDSNYALQYELPGTFSPVCNFDLLKRATFFAEQNAIPFYAGQIISSDLFSSYNARGENRSWQPWAKMGCLAQDMETYALYCNAAYLGKKALSITTNVCSCVTGENMFMNGHSSLDPMIKTALSLV